MGLVQVRGLERPAVAAQDRGLGRGDLDRTQEVACVSIQLQTTCSDSARVPSEMLGTSLNSVRQPGGRGVLGSGGGR